MNDQPNLLYQRLENALQQGSEVHVVSSCGKFVGIPISIDGEFLELVNLYIPTENDEWEDEPYERIVWLIKLSEITAVASVVQSWSKSQFEQLLNPKKTALESED